MPPKKRRLVESAPAAPTTPEDPAPNELPILGVFMIEDREINDLLNSLNDEERQRVFGNPTLLPILLRGAKRKEVSLNQFKDLGKKIFSKFFLKFPNF